MPPKKSTKSKSLHEVSEDREVIDINVSGSESESERTKDSVQRLRTGLEGAAPSLDSTDSRSSRTAQDIQYFFQKTVDQKRRCNICQRDYFLKTSSGNLRNHLDKVHKDEYLKVAKEHGWEILLQSVKDEAAKLHALATVSKAQVTFSPEGVINQLVRFITVNDQPLNIVENPEFRALLTLFRDDYTDDLLPHRMKMRSSIIETWNAWFSQLKTELSQAAGALHFTADAWSDQKLQTYICITVHWLAYKDRDKKAGLTLKSSLLAFQPIVGSHTAENLAENVFRLLERAGVNGGDGSHWTLDMAAVNDAMLRALKDIYHRRRPDVVFLYPDCRILCFPHVINISTQHAIEALNKSVLSRKAEGGSEDEEDITTDEEGKQSDALNKLRSLIIAIRSSGQRNQNFKEVIEAGNQLEWWKDDKDEAFCIKPRQLIRDVKTRWDSTYLMITRALEFRQPLDMYLTSNKYNTKELMKYKLSDEEWDQILDMIGILEYAHQVQQVMSAEKTPILAGAVPTLEFFMTSWEVVARQNEHLKPIIDKALSFTYKYYKKMDNTRAYVISMFVHPGIRMSWIKDKWDTKFMNDAEKMIKKMMSDYRSKHSADEKNLPNNDSAFSSAGNNKSNLGYVNLILQPAHVNSKINLPSRLRVDRDNDMLNWSSETLECPSVEGEFMSYAYGAQKVRIDVDILDWWEANRQQFPTVYAIALDYLAIQASAVPCERAFSSCAETDTSRRNRLKPFVVEALQMLKYGFRNEPFNFTEGLLMHEEDLVLPEHVESDLLAELADNSITDTQREDVMDRIIKSMNDD